MFNCMHVYVVLMSTTLCLLLKRCFHALLFVLWFCDNKKHRKMHVWWINTLLAVWYYLRAVSKSNFSLLSLARNKPIIPACRKMLTLSDCVAFPVFHRYAIKQKLYLPVLYITVIHKTPSIFHTKHSVAFNFSHSADLIHHVRSKHYCFHLLCVY